MGTLFRTFKQYLGKALQSDLQSGANTYYIFAGKATSWTDDNNPPSVFESVDSSFSDVSRQMMFGKKISNTNFRFLASRYDWSSNTVYSQYTNSDINLYTENFYVITDERKVYKCLYNNKGVPSTVKPTQTVNTAFTSATDGYVWKYMYTVSSTDLTQYGSTKYIPVTPNTGISNSAIAGIDVIEVVSGGSNYRTTVNGTIQSVVSSTVVQIDNFASTDNNFYVNSAIYITGGPGAGQLAGITAYVSNSSGNFVTTNTALSSITPSFSFYTISPKVVVTGDGTGVLAYSVVNTANYSISKIVVTNTGTGYTYANVSIQAAASYGSGANVVAYVPPYGGHGFDAVEELGCTNIGFYLEFNTSESNTIPTEAKYRQVGLLSNPQYYGNTSTYTANTFNNLLRVTTSPATTFTVGETVVGNTSGAVGYVAFSNSTITMLTGDKIFSSGERITGLTSTLFANITISNTGDIKPLTTNILYYNNIIPVQRSNTQNEAVKFVITL